MKDQPNCIQVYLRLRPTKKASVIYGLTEEENKINFQFQKDPSKGYVNNAEKNHEFYFDKIFNQQTKQEQVFDSVAKEVIDSCLDGYNGTIFAYGQTGSGKTYTITGGVEKYVDRGLIPRTIGYIFNEAKKKTNMTIKVNVSYLEIYNDQGYDLLDQDHSTKNLMDLPKVLLFENENEVHFIKFK